MTKLAKASDKDKRVQFDVLPERLSEMDQVMVFCEMKTRKDLFDQALTLFEWAVHEVREGKEIASFNRQFDQVEIVRFPVLERAARRAKNFKPALVDTTNEMAPYAPLNKAEKRQDHSGKTVLRIGNAEDQTA